VLFQPHRFSRTQILAQDFGGAFKQADRLILLPIYSAGEDPIAGVDSGLIAEAVRTHTGERPAMAANFEQAAGLLKKILAPGDLVLTLGAGNVRKLGEMLLDRG
jgi:UDP-N-acetylmuramate--alanine ligase